MWGGESGFPVFLAAVDSKHKLYWYTPIVGLGIDREAVTTGRRGPGAIVRTVLRATSAYKYLTCSEPSENTESQV